MYPGIGVRVLSVQEVGTKTVNKKMTEPSTLDISLIVDPFQIHTGRRLLLKEKSKG